MQSSKFFNPAQFLPRRFSIQAFDKYFLHSDATMNQTEQIIKNCQLDQIFCRFNIWRLCLKVVSSTASIQEKIDEINNTRISYRQKKQQCKRGFGKSPNKQKNIPKNPLMMMNNKPDKKQQENDDFLKQQIRKDVDRTYQEMQFFQNQDILKLLSQILYVWCKRNPQVSYKQGMNQILASVVYCYFMEVQFRGLNQKPEHATQELWKNHIHFNSKDYAEPDIYNVFQKIMNIQGDMYKTQADQGIKSKVNPNSKNNTPILQRIIQIKDHKLKTLDLQLFRIIKLQDVQTKSFMLRWIRCMHTRQFNLQSSFIIWDSIFLDYFQSPISKIKGQFQFIDAMCLAMFIYMRSIVLSRQTAGQILQVYQKYPSLKRGEYLQQLITLAWSVCQQLRIQNQSHIAVQNQIQTNWFEQSNEAKKLSFMQKGGGISSKIHLQQQQQKKLNQQQISGQHKPRQKSPQKRIEHNSPDNHIKQKSHKKQSIKKQIQSKSQAQNNQKITLESNELIQMISILNRSIQCNSDIQSKTLAQKVLGKLQNLLNQLEG